MACKLDYRWNLRQVMAARGRFATTDLSEPLAERGVRLSSSQGWVWSSNKSPNGLGPRRRRLTAPTALAPKVRALVRTRSVYRLLSGAAHTRRRRFRGVSPLMMDVRPRAANSATVRPSSLVLQSGFHFRLPPVPERSRLGPVRGYVK